MTNQGPNRSSSGVAAFTPSSEAEERVWASLGGVIDPEIHRPVTELGMITGIAIDESGAADVSLKLTIAGCPAARRIEADVTEATLSTAGITDARIDVGVMTPEERQAFVETVRGPARPAQFGPDSLTRVIAVTSGKGGVGKSSLTASLAVSLAQQGLTVGLIDADVFGFSIPGIMGLSRDGITEQPTQVGDMILPPEIHGVRVISIGMFLGDADPRSTAVSWRGPMLHRTIEQFLRDVFFGDLDVLLLDLPPGTGDVAISIGQLLPQAEVLVVTTPQEAAADVAVRSALVARQTGQRVIGVIENMAGLAQPDGTILDIFGTGGGAAVVDRLNQSESAAGQQPVLLLGSVPLSPTFREGGDTGAPSVLTHPDDPAAREIIRIATGIASQGRGLQGKPLGLSVR